jgi:hypothetical protein
MLSLSKPLSQQTDSQAAAREAAGEVLAKQKQQQMEFSILQQLQQKLQSAAGRLTGWKQVGADADKA